MTFEEYAQESLVKHGFTEVDTTLVRMGWNAAKADMDEALRELEVMRKRVAGLEESGKQLSAMFHDKVVGEQAAYIEWQHGKGAEAGMQWIANGLWGPGLIPDEDEPWGTEAQAYYDANKSDPFPQCFCGRPSNQLWMGKGACCDEHMTVIRQQAKDAEKGGGSL